MTVVVSVIHMPYAMLPELSKCKFILGVVGNGKRWPRLHVSTQLLCHRVIDPLHRDDPAPPAEAHTVVATLVCHVQSNLCQAPLPTLQ